MGREQQRRAANPFFFSLAGLSPSCASPTRGGTKGWRTRHCFAVGEVVLVCWFPFSCVCGHLVVCVCVCFPTSFLLQRFPSRCRVQMGVRRMWTVAQEVMGGKHKERGKLGFQDRCVRRGFWRKPSQLMGERICNFCSETNVWPRWRCRRCYSNTPSGQGKYRQAVQAKTREISSGSSSSSGGERKARDPRQKSEICERRLISLRGSRKWKRGRECKANLHGQKVDSERTGR